MAGPIYRSSTTAPAGFVRFVGSLAISFAGMLVLPLGASAHTSQAVAPRDLMQFWTPDPTVIVACLVTGWLYLRGVGRLREIGERTGRGPIIQTGRIAAFWCGLATLLIALASPLDTATASVFSAHMVQHVLLIAVAPPLILLGNPMTVIMNGLPRSWRRPIAQLEH
ncbi:MAG TPA: cytochrome c oxidase assembly protein, partial [Thermomicrobiales bacterium]|nr:cytochrome c oxidase assembly protein [Thermomicrobiales bacterium]